MENVLHLYKTAEKPFSIYFIKHKKDIENGVTIEVHKACNGQFHGDFYCKRKTSEGFDHLLYEEKMVNKVTCNGSCQLYKNTVVVEDSSILVAGFGV